MLLPLLAAAQLQAAAPTGAAPARPPQEYSGVKNKLSVATPRLDRGPEVDGVLREPQWALGVVLRDLSQYSRLDQRQAEDSTKVLGWYGEDAIYFGIRALAAPGTVQGASARTR